MNRARFPVVKGFDGYDFTEIRLSPAFSRVELLACQFLQEKRNLVL